MNAVTVKTIRQYRAETAEALAFAEAMEDGTVIASEYGFTTQDAGREWAWGAYDSEVKRLARAAVAA